MGIEQAPKGEFKRLTCGVIYFDKGGTITFSQCIASKHFNSHWVGKNLINLVSFITKG